MQILHGRYDTPLLTRRFSFRHGGSEDQDQDLSDGLNKVASFFLSCYCRLAI